MKCLLLIFLLIPGFIYSQTPLIRAENSSSFTNDTVLVAITASNFSDIGAITLKIQFSSESLSFISVVNWDSRLNEALSGIDGNVITLAWDGLNAVSYTYGKIAELKFIYKGGLGEVKFNSTLSEIADSSGKAISCTYTGGTVTQIPAPSAPALISPVNLSQILQSEQILTWNSADNVKNYRLQVSRDSLFTDIFLSDSSITGSSRKVQGLSNKTSYFWRVRAVNNSGTSPWSQVWTFKTIITVPLKPIPVSPADLSRHQPADLRLSWTPSQGAESYSVNLYEYVLKGSEYIVNLRSSLSNITAASIDISGLLEGTKYVWTVKARNIAGVSDSSSST
ncbi:MAG: fibronectin type III domain-containing protein, partial [Syntrophothermus sp.]